jgi:hypothetical protein
MPGSTGSQQAELIEFCQACGDHYADPADKQCHILISQKVIIAGQPVEAGDQADQNAKQCGDVANKP